MIEQEKVTMWTRIKRFWNESRRVLVVTKKPTNEEFKNIVKVTGLGLLIIGMIGFVIQTIQQVFL